MNKQRYFLRRAARQLVLGFTLVVFLAAVIGFSRAGTGEVRLTIFHVNDIHGRIDNFAKIAWQVREERKTNANVFFVNAGDNFSGNPVVDQYEPKGKPMQVLMNMMGYDVMTLGNHEFDYGQEILKDFMEKADFHILCANLETSADAVMPQPKAHVILKTKGGIKVAFLGVIQLEESGIPSTHPAKLEGLAFKPGIETAKKYKNLRNNCDLFIALTHLGAETDEILAREMAELDIIIGGHSHTRIETRREINNVLITQAGSYARYLGRIDITLKNGKIIQKEAKLIDVASIKNEIPAIKEKIIDYNNNPRLNRVLVTLPKPVQGTAALGNLITDAVTKVHHLDIAFHNNGGIRSHRLGKDVRLKDIYTLLPFGNYVVRFDMNPAEIRSLLTNDFEKRGSLDLCVSGITYKIIHKKGNRVIDIELRDKSGKLLDEQKSYKVGMNDYMASAYPFSHRDPGRSLNVIVAETLIEYLQNEKDVTRDIDKPRAASRLVDD